jgi:predicted metal-dependent hydrolase
MEERSVQYGTTTVWYTMVRASRRTLGLMVRPDAHVEVRAPLNADVTKVDELVLRKARWIVRQQDYLPLLPADHSCQANTLAGKAHRYLGKQYRLKVHAYNKAYEEVKLSGRSHPHPHPPSERR